MRSRAFDPDTALRGNSLDILAEGLEGFMVRSGSTVRQAMDSIDRNSEGAVMVVDERERLLGIVTDGDIRRAILRNIGLDQPIIDILAHKESVGRPTVPVTCSPPLSRAKLLTLMADKGVRQVPIVGDGDVVLGLALYSRISKFREELPVQAVIMAGGFGTRLRPLTVDTPKPMLPVAGRPIIEHIVNKLEESGIRQCAVTTHYLPEKIEDHLGDGSKFGINIRYVHEEQPMGTAGALHNLDHTGDQPLLVMNGDILTHVDFQAMYQFHTEHKAAFTVGVRTYEFQVPYGVLQMDGPNVVGLAEKPTTRLFINAGVYLIQPEALNLIPKDRRFDMTDLIQALIDMGKSVVSFPIFEYWIDVGRPEDYAKADEFLKK